MPVASTRATDLATSAVAEVSATLRHLLADVFALCVKCGLSDELSVQQRSEPIGPSSLSRSS
jgi:hypothetical protein